jgi:hypothetical protein
MPQRTDLAEAGAMSDWFEKIGNDLGMQAEGVRAALRYIRSVCGSSGTAWVESAREVLQGPVTVYVLAEGVLHRVVGAKDRPPDARDPGAYTESECKYTIQPIRKSANYTVTVATRIGSQTGIPGRSNPLGTVRSWRFTGLGAFGTLEFASPRPDRHPPGGPDPTLFAEALTAEILRIKQRRPDGSQRLDDLGNRLGSET